MVMTQGRITKQLSETGKIQGKIVPISNWSDKGCDFIENAAEINGSIGIIFIIFFFFFFINFFLFLFLFYVIFFKIKKLAMIPRGVCTFAEKILHGSFSHKNFCG